MDDLDDQVAQLAAQGLPVGPIDVIAGSVHSVVISDPEGNRITCGQPRRGPRRLTGSPGSV
jgi:hypothetical protein